MQRSGNELIRPSEPINGRTLNNLKVVLESVVGDGEVRDLDLAMLLNVPVTRLGRLKKSGYQAEVEASEDAGEEQEHAPAIRPNHAVLVRLLLRYPEYVPIPPRPSNAEMFELLAPLMPEDAGRGRQGYAPLFGRSYVSSYKMLAEQEATSLPVMRLQMLITGCLADIFRELCLAFCRQASGVCPSMLWMLSATIPAGLFSGHGIL